MNEEIKELKEKIIVLQNFYKVKDKKLKLMEDRIERQNKLIAKQKELIEVKNKEIEKLKGIISSVKEDYLAEKARSDDLEETIRKSRELVKVIGFQIGLSVSGSYNYYLRLRDTEQGKELLALLGDNDE